MKSYLFKHDLQTVGQEYVCRRCHRRWDFDEAPSEEELCDVPITPKKKKPVRKRSYKESKAL